MEVVRLSMAQYAPPNALSMTTETRGTMTLGYIIKRAAPFDRICPSDSSCVAIKPGTSTKVITGR
jgi:hypothetical protein